jgi:hypothetical protein
MIPDWFQFSIPNGYEWLLTQKLIGFVPDSPLYPWHYLDKEAAFYTNELWPGAQGSMSLFAFARRQDCDDLACFNVESGMATKIVVIHGWTNVGYNIVAVYDTFWDWLKSVIDDISFIVDSM